MKEVVWIDNLVGQKEVNIWDTVKIIVKERDFRTDVKQCDRVYYFVSFPPPKKNWWNGS
jgi:hypothetical protein